MTRFLALGSLGSGLLLAGLAGPAAAEVVPAPIFGDHMVLQSDRPVPVFGQTEPGGQVSVTATVVTDAPPDDLINERPAATATADENGRWSVTVGPFQPGTNLTLVVADADAADASAEGEADTADRKVYTDVLAGDVWLCSGQSNMAWGLNNTLDADREIQSAKNDEIRLFTVPRQSVREPKTTLSADAQWMKLSPESARNFSAVGYYFGKTIHTETGRPLGLINSSWGGTPSEAWTRPATLEKTDTAGPLLERWEKTDDADTNRPHHRPGVLNNGMITPLVPFALKGAIWYQGESNAGRAEQYDEIFPAMIEDWRDQFGQPLPFFWVQLANFRAYEDDPNAGSDWAELREAQDNTLDELPDVGQAVIIDVGEANDIHPRNKEDVGQRLALAALEVVYDMDETGQLSPRMTDVAMDGKTATVTFDTDGDALQIRRDESVGADAAAPGEALGFAVAGPDKTFHWAQAELTGPNTVKVTAPAGVSEIVAVRYAWADNPKVTLFNTRGLPAAPFRTDDWPGVTAGNY
ncbi:sialate O-acetylesterase [Alienimonas sp. DA493]|uniref:sialate O-acetylesterase n=1 Tax=Alienimonas sp. DA493 TaxID=3373605 RepID=UPI003754FFEA